MLLRHLINAVPTLHVDGLLDREVSGITYDSRRVTPGMVFVAVPGARTDGHEYIGTAIDRGASAVICERNGFGSQRVTKIKVADARLALAAAAAAYYDHPSRKLKVVGVTGTNGKTTVAFMVKHILETAGIPCGLLGTVRYEIRDRLIPAQRTTPEAPEIQQMMAQMIRAGCQACVMEVSSHALEQKRVHGVEFDLGVFTNLTQDHLDYHGTMDRYFSSKQNLFTAAARGSKPGGAVINVDDPSGARLVEASDAAVRLTYGLNPSAQLRASNIRLERDGSALTVATAGTAFECRLPLIGRHNIYNALAASGAALLMNVRVPSLQSALNSMPPVPGRLESIALGQPFGVFVDYAHTDDALSNVLGTLREITRGRVLVAFGCGGNRDAGKREKMGRVAAGMADLAIITSDNPRRESPETIARQVETGYRLVRAEGCRIELDRQRAIDEIIRLARAGDSVLIAGKGHETYQEIEDTVIPFDDRLQAADTLETLGWSARPGGARHAH